MSQKNRQYPDWAIIGSELLNPLLSLLVKKSEERQGGSANTNFVCQGATIHFAQCLELSERENRKGHHAISMCILRQCIEALSIIEVGLNSNIAWADGILEKWHGNAITLGKIRKQLQVQAWPLYGKGLWAESWSEFFSQLSSAVQPYAHYTRDLLAWQMQILHTPTASREVDSGIVLNAKIGPNTYDADKATRVTLYQTVLLWAVGRIILENSNDSRLPKDKLLNLGNALSKAQELGLGHWSWEEQFWATEFTNPE